MGIARKVANQLPGNPKCNLTPSLLMSSRQTPTKEITMSQRDHHTLLSDPRGNNPQGPKPVAWEPKMHLDAITINVVSADTNQSDKKYRKDTITLCLAILMGIIRKVANQLPGNQKCTLMPSLLMWSRQTPTKPIKISQSPSHFA